MSRLAVHECLRAILRNHEARSNVASLVAALSREASKSSLSSANAFILVEWCCVLLQEIRLDKNIWDEHGISILLAVANLLKTCSCNAKKPALKRSAFKKVQYTLRLVYCTKNYSSEFFNASVDALLDAKNADVSNMLILGIISKLASTTLHLERLLLSRKDDFTTFYIRKIVESRVRLPPIITESFDTFFQKFCTYSDLESVILPAVEKALLRMPEILLNGQIKPLFESQNEEMDMSNLLEKNFAKSLLAYVGSSDQRLRIGAADLLKCLIVRSHNMEIMEKTAGNILHMLQKSQSSIPEQKVLLADILSCFPFSPRVSRDISFRLTQIIQKESNEQAATALIKSAMDHFRKELIAESTADEKYPVQLCQALETKNHMLQRLWTTHIGELLWQISSRPIENPEFLQLVVKLLHALNHVAADGNTSLINAPHADQILALNILTALVPSKFRTENVGEVAEHVTRTLHNRGQLNLKDSQLFNIRLNAKLTDENDIRWAVRALAALSSTVIGDNEFNRSRIIWSQSFIYFVTSVEISRELRKEILNELFNLYKSHPIEISSLVYDGLWAVLWDLTYNEKSLISTHYRAGKTFLAHVIKTICPAKDRFDKAGAVIDDPALRLRLADLVIICQPSLISNISWINVCLESGQDPGILAAQVPDRCMAKIKEIVEVIHRFD